jgi:hypothetical protein
VAVDGGTEPQALAYAPAEQADMAVDAMAAQRVKILRYSGLAAMLALAWALAACSSDTKTSGTKDAGKADSAVVDSNDGDQTDSDTVVDTEGELPGDVLDSDDAPADEVLDVEQADQVDAAAEIDTEPVDTAQCVTSTDCASVLNLQACQDAFCDLGVCKPVPKPYPSCCNSAACNDKDECTQDTCDIATAQCVNKTDPNCCSGKLTLLKTGFEAGGFDGLKATEGATNGSVIWHPTEHRAHSGSSSLYFGNECYTYDTSASQDDGCKPGASPAAVQTSLLTPDYVLPAGSTAHLVFWLWLDAEPPYSSSFSVGTCKPTCPQGSSCVVVNGASQCLVEKDVLSVGVVEAAKSTPLFWSTQIGKTTGGGWKRVALDISAWAGKTVKLQWQFQTGTGIKNSYEGIYLDDVVIETVCAQLACDPNTTCKDDSNTCTTETCVPYANDSAGVGACLFDKIPGCCVQDGDCDDGVACTVDSCQNGECQSKPDASKPSCCKASVSLYSGFDAGTLEGWTAQQQNSAQVGWHAVPTAGVTGGALAFSSQSGDSYSDPDLGDAGPKGLICSAPLTLKQGTNYNLLTFQLKLETEWSGYAAKDYKNPPVDGLPKYDWFTVQVLDQGALKVVWSSDLVYGTTGGLWQAVTVPLDSWQGKTVQVCLGFDAADSNKNDFAGPLIDELALKVACSKQACYMNSECDNLSCGTCQAALCEPSVGCGCQAVVGCCLKDSECDDNNLCTTDSCKTSACVHDTVPDCTP